MASRQDMQTVYRDALIDLMFLALADSQISSEARLLADVLHLRNKGMRKNDPPPEWIRRNLPHFLAKMVSGGRLGIVYFRRDEARS